MIERCRDEFPVRLMCRCLRVSASGYYDWSKRLPSARELDNQRPVPPAYLQDILEAGRRLTTLVDDILAKYRPRLEGKKVMLAAGDTLVLSGHPNALLSAQDKLLRG